MLKLVRGYSSQLRVLLALLARRLPQPNLRVSDAELPPQARHRLQQLVEHLLGQLMPQMPRISDRDHMDFNSTIPHLGHVSQMALDVMAYLENGQYDELDSVAEDEHAPGPATVENEETSNDVPQTFMPGLSVTVPAMEVDPPPEMLSCITAGSLRGLTRPVNSTGPLLRQLWAPMSPHLLVLCGHQNQFRHRHR